MPAMTRSIATALMVSIAAVGLTGCETMNRNRTATGAVIGGAVGTAAGALIDEDNPWRGALIGLAAGTALGGGVGYVLEKQKEAFERIEDLEVRQEQVILQQPPVYTESAPGEYTSPPQSYSERTDALMVRVSSDVLFEQGSSALSPHGVTKVREIAGVLKEYPESDVYIRGYTSSEGDDRVNFELSQRRAQVVANELVAAGVSPSRLFPHGMGSSNPVAPNDTESGRVQNRRVELHVVPRGEAA